MPKNEHNQLSLPTSPSSWVRQGVVLFILISQPMRNRISKTQHAGTKGLLFSEF